MPVQIPEDFAKLKKDFLNRVKTNIKTYKIPLALVLNWDQTGVSIRPTNDWTMDPKGAKQVVVEGGTDKRMITMQLCGSAAGTLLPPQVIYEGKTSRCEPNKELTPEHWDVTHTPSHWVSLETIKRFLSKIVSPYLKTTKTYYKLPADQHGLMIIDLYPGQIKEEVVAEVKKYNLELVFVPAKCTDKLQPMDQIVNSKLKTLMKNQYSDWYASCVLKFMKTGKKAEDFKVDSRLCCLKPLHMTWMKKSVGCITNYDVKKSFAICNLRKMDTDDISDPDNDECEASQRPMVEELEDMSDNASEVHELEYDPDTCKHDLIDPDTGACLFCGRGL